MNARQSKVLKLCLLALALADAPTRADLYLSELFFNPPGTDAPNQYIELRGTPNLVLPSGTYLLTIEGDAGANPGTIQNLFDLSGRRIGGNGFLLLLEKGAAYVPNPGAAMLMNTNAGPGWGSGPTSSLGHKGNNGITDLKHPSVTFFLIQTTNAPRVGDDLDPGNTGVLDPGILAGWTVLDSIGVLDADGAGDFAYGAVNFRLITPPGSGASAPGAIVPVGFVARYLGRTGNTTGSAAGDWVAADGLTGSAPNWLLGASTNTVPSSFAGEPLNHLGGANFGAPAIPGVILTETDGFTRVSKSGMTDTYSLALNTTPSGPVTLQLSCAAPLEISANGGVSFAMSQTVVFSNQTPVTITIRADDDHIINNSSHWRWITNTIAASADLSHYPLTTLVPGVRVEIVELLLTELKVNPPGTNDAPNEFIELNGPPGAALTNVVLLALDGNSGGDPGKITYLRNLSGIQLGTNGVLVIVATNHPYSIPGGTVAVTDPQFSQAGGALGNGSISFLLLSTTTNLNQGDDLDKGNNGVLEGIPPDANLLDAVAWSDGDNNDVTYGANLVLPGRAPDAATRFPGDQRPNCAAAWFFGDLLGPEGASLIYDTNNVSPNFPTDTPLTPGAVNNTAPFFGPIVLVSGVIGDPWNPTISFTVADREAPSSNLLVTASSANPAVVPTTNLSLTFSPDGARTLALNPVGVGYADITLRASDGSMTGIITFPYAASAPGRPGGTWHLGASDGSAAIATAPDLMLIGDDETQLLRLYSRSRSSLPLAQFNMNPFLGLTDFDGSVPREVDIEASTRVGNRLFWIGSHGHGDVGEVRPNRCRIFATDLSGAGTNLALNYAGRYDYLKTDLLNWDRNNLHGKGTNYYGLEASDAVGVPPKVPDGSGFSIEGLSMMPGSTNGAYVAFRAPIVPATNRNYALIVPVLNFATLAVSGAPAGLASFGPPIELDLYGRGIRSIEGDTNGYIFIGGTAAAAPSTYPHDFRLYTWTGNPADKPQQRTADLSGLGPEGVVELPPPPWTTNTQVQLLTDNGGTEFYGDGVKAKELTVWNFKKCRTDFVALGSITKPAPFFTSIALQGTTLTLQWRALQGETYHLESASRLNPPDWSPVPGQVIAPGPFAAKDLNVSGPAQFYRVAIANP